MTLQADTRSAIERARDRYPLARSAILPALWAVQHEQGLITPDAMTDIAGILQVTPSEVEAVSTFYSMYFQRPHGRHEVIVCINVSCALRGADEIVDHLERSLACKSGETTADGEFTWSSTVECLGGCGGAPTMQVDHHFEEHLTPERVDAVLGALRQSAPAGGVAGSSAGRRLGAEMNGPRTQDAEESDPAAERRGGPATTGPAGPPTTPREAPKPRTRRPRKAQQ
ncbi:MAG: NADH-quinone oxidoreductase subunit NuoE [Candidatus Dormiibacterota bacterium]